MTKCAKTRRQFFFEELKWLLKLALIAVVIIAASAFIGKAWAFECSPKDTTARILQSPSPNALHKDWRGENTIGLSWSLHGRSVVQDHLMGQLYVVGDLISPRGGVVNRNVYVLKNEWRCVK